MEHHIMKLDIEAFDRAVKNGLLIQGNWGNAPAGKKACIMGWLAGATGENECVAKGWPLWLVELFEWANDQAPQETFIRDMTRLAHAANAANSAGLDTDRLWKEIRLNAILPIAMESIEEGDKPWQLECRKAVQWSIDHGGAANPRAAEAARAAGAGWAGWAAGAAGAGWAAAGAARAAGAGWAGWAAGAGSAAWVAGAAEAAAGAARAARAAATRRITDELLAALERQAT